VNVAVDDVVATGVPVSNTYVYEITKATPVGDKDPAGIFAAGVHDTPNPVEVMELGTIAKPVGATGASWILIEVIATEVSTEEELSYFEYKEKV
jgi:hypothetical protein